MVITAVFTYSLIASCACLISFFFIAYNDSKKAADAAGDAKAIKTRAAPSDTADSLARLAEATGKLVEALTKAGPSLSALAASILFAMIAAYIARPVLPNASNNTTSATASGNTSAAGNVVPGAPSSSK